MEKQIKYYFLEGSATFKGFIKNGFDTSTIINLIVAFDSEFVEFKKRGFTFPPNLFYFHEISWSETIGVLINEHKLTKEEAIDALKKLILEFRLKKIKRNEETDKFFEKIVEEANKKVVKNSNNLKLKIGDQDIIIIAGFLKEKINFVHSGDNGFLETCNELGLNIIPLPIRDREKEEQIKKMMKKRKS